MDEQGTGHQVEREGASGADTTTGLPAVAPETLPGMYASAAPQGETADQPFRALEAQRAQRRRKRSIKIIATVVIVVVIAFAGALAIRAKLLSNAAAATTVSTGTVTRGDFDKEVSGTGKLNPVNSVTVTPEVTDGVVTSVSVAQGDTVSAGQVLFTMSSDTISKTMTTAQQGLDSANLALKQAQAGVSSAQSAVTQAESARQSAIDTYDGNLSTAQQQLAAAQAAGDAAAIAKAQESLASLGSLNTSSLDSAVDSATSGVTSAQNAVDTASLAQSQAKSSYDSAVAASDKLNVTASISGQITVLNVEVGTSLAALTTAGKTACQIADLSKMVMTLPVNEIDISTVATGQAAMVEVDAITGLTLNATVDKVAATTTSSSTSSATSSLNTTSVGVVTYDVNLLISNPDPRLKPGMSATATILFKHYTDVLQVPLTSLQGSTGDQHVTVQDADGTTHDVPVTVVTSDDLTAVVEGDLADGDTVTTPFATSSSTSLL